MTVSTETRRAFEALLMVADEPIPASLCAQLLEMSQADLDEMADALIAEYEASRSRLCAAARRRRLSLLQPSRHGALRRAVRARRPDRRACRTRRSRRSRSWRTSSRSRGARSLRSAASTSTPRCARSSSGATAPRSAATTGPGQAVLYGTTPMFLEKLGLDCRQRSSAAGRLRARTRSDGGLREQPARGSGHRCGRGRSRPKRRLRRPSSPDERRRRRRRRAPPENPGPTRLRESARLRET